MTQRQCLSLSCFKKERHKHVCTERNDFSLSACCPQRLIFNTSVNVFLKPVLGFAEESTPSVRRLRWSDKLYSILSQTFISLEMGTLRYVLSQHSTYVIKTLMTSILNSGLFLQTTERSVQRIKMLHVLWNDYF